MFNVHIAIDCDPFLILWFFDSRGEVTHVYLSKHAKSDYQPRWYFSTRNPKQGLGWCICRWMDKIRDEINGRGMGPRDQTFRPCLCPYTSVSVYFFCGNFSSSSRWTMKALYDSCSKHYHSPKESRFEWYVHFSFRDLFLCTNKLKLPSRLTQWLWFRPSHSQFCGCRKGCSFLECSETELAESRCCGLWSRSWKWVVRPWANERHHFLFQQTFRVGSCSSLWVWFKTVRVEENVSQLWGI